MSRLNAISRSLLGLVLVAGLATHTTSHAEKDLSAETPTQSIQASAFLSMLLAHHLKQMRPGDGAIREAIGTYYFISTLTAAGQVTSTLLNLELTDSPMLAHALASLPFLVIGQRMHAADDPKNPKRPYIPFVAAGLSQLGEAARRVIAKNGDAIQAFAEKNFAEQHRPHALEITKITTTLGGLILITMAFKPGDPVKFKDAKAEAAAKTSFAAFAGSVAGSSTFTLVYMAREGLIAVLPSYTSFFPHYLLSSALSAAGAIGLAYSAPFGVPFLASLALLEAGTFTTAETTVSYATQAHIYARVAQVVSAIVGALLYLPADDAKTTRQRIRRQAGQALLLPLAFGLVGDFTKLFKQVHVQ